VLDDVIKAYNETVLNTDRAAALQVVSDAIGQGISPEDVVFKIVIPGLDLMVKAISEGFDTNLAQHFMTSQIAADVTCRRADFSSGLGQDRYGRPKCIGQCRCKRFRDAPCDR